MKALVTGGTGFVGRALIARLRGARVLSRDAAHAGRALGGVEAFSWDPAAGPPPADAFAGVDAVFHLAGEPVAQRWNEATRRAIRDSRVLGTRRLVEGMRALSQRPSVLVSASAVGWYGDRGDAELDEGASAAKDFLGEVCRAWEEEAAAAESLGMRVVRVRIGVVLGRGGGALREMLLPFRLGLGGRIGHGRQWMPWIHIEDLVGILLHAAATESISGPVNGVAPGVVTNAAFTAALGAALHRPAFLPVPVFALRLLKGDFVEVLTASTRAVPRAALRSGYVFTHPEVEGALRACV